MASTMTSSVAVAPARASSFAGAKLRVASPSAALPVRRGTTRRHRASPAITRAVAGETLIQVEKPLGRFAITVNLAILIATLTMILETLPELQAESDAILAFEVIEFVCVAIFTLELLIKIAVSPPRALGRLICSFMTLVDVGAITPFYLNLVIQEPQCWTGVPALLNGNAWPPLPPECDNALTAFAFLRTIRLLRVVRVLRHPQDEPATARGGRPLRLWLADAWCPRPDGAEYV